MFLHSDQSRISQEEPLPPENVIGKHYPDKPIYFFANRGLSGPYFILYAGQSTKNFDTTAWNGRISSVLLSPKTKVVLYSIKFGFAGEAATLDNSAHNSESDGRWMYADLETWCVAQNCARRLLKEVTRIVTS
jgi:hypothetical protein